MIILQRVLVIDVFVFIYNMQEIFNVITVCCDHSLNITTLLLVPLLCVNTLCFTPTSLDCSTFLL